MDTRYTATTCPYCGCGCGLTLESAGGDEVKDILRALPAPNSPVSQGKLCIKGWNAHEFVRHPDRLMSPLQRTDGAWKALSWKEAFELAGKKLAHIRDKYGPDSIGVLSSARCINEENYLLQKLTRCALGTNNIDHCARL